MSKGKGIRVFERNRPAHDDTDTMLFHQDGTFTWADGAPVLGWHIADMLTVVDRGHWAEVSRKNRARKKVTA